MANSAAAEFLELSQRASACAESIAKLRWLAIYPELESERDALRDALYERAERLAGELGDSLRLLEKYVGAFGGLGLSIPFVLGGRKYVSGHEAAFRLARDVLDLIRVFAYPTVKIDWLNCELSPSDPAAPFSDGIAPTALDLVKYQIDRAPWLDFPSDELGARIAAERELIAASLGEESPADKREEPAIETDLKLDERAVALYVSRPGIKKKDMAPVLNCHVKSLTPDRCPRLAAAIRAYRAPDLPRGSKDSDGNVEAWDDSPRHAR